MTPEEISNLKRGDFVWVKDRFIPSDIRISKPCILKVAGTRTCADGNKIVLCFTPTGWGLKIQPYGWCKMYNLPESYAGLWAEQFYTHKINVINI